MCCDLLSENPSIHNIFLPLSIPFSWTQLLILVPHTSPYLWYLIVVANVKYGSDRFGLGKLSKETIHQTSPIPKE